MLPQIEFWVCCLQSFRCTFKCNCKWILIYASVSLLFLYLYTFLVGSNMTGHLYIQLLPHVVFLKIYWMYLKCTSEHIYCWAIPKEKWPVARWFSWLQLLEVTRQAAVMIWLLPHGCFSKLLKSSSYYMGTSILLLNLCRKMQICEFFNVLLVKKISLQEVTWQTNVFLGYFQNIGYSGYYNRDLNKHKCNN